MSRYRLLQTAACTAAFLAATILKTSASCVGPQPAPTIPSGAAARMTVNWNQPLPAPLAKVPAIKATSVPEPSGPPTLGFTPGTIAGDFRGYVEVMIGNLAGGESVRLEKFQVNNTSGTVDGTAVLVESLLLTDGQNGSMGGVPNPNLTADSTAEDGQITAELGFLDAFLPSMAGEYVFRLSSPSNRFAPLTRRFTVTAAPAGQQISGTVTDGTAGVPYAYVALFEVEGNSYDFIAGTVADAQGAYAIPAPPGAYQLLAAKPGFVGKFDIESKLVRLRAGVNRVMNPVLTAGTRTLSGKICDAANPALGLPGVQLLLRNSSQTKLAIAYSDAAGNWSADVTPDEWEIEVLAFGVNQIGYVGLRDPLFADANDDSVSDIELSLPRAVTLVHGTVADAGAPLPYVDLVLFSQDLNYWVTVSTDENGEYTAAVSAGAWQVRLDAASLEDLGYAGVVTNFVPLAAGQVATANFAPLATTTNVAGSVVTDLGDPVDGAAFTVDDGATPLNYVAGETDEDAEFFIALPTGTFRFEIVLESLAGLDLIDAQAPPLTTTGADVTDLELVLKTPTAHLTVHVKDQYGRAVTDLPVLATALIGGQVHRAFDYTDEDGDVRLPVIDGTWTLQLDGANEYLKLEPQGFATIPNRDIPVAGADVDDELTLTATPDPAPTITAILDQTILEDGNTGSLAFTVGDDFLPPEDLIVEARSSNPTLVPVENIVLGGTGAQRTAVVTPAANQFGTATITIRVTDDEELSFERTFTLTVTSVNDVPGFTMGPNRIVVEDSGNASFPNQAIAISPGPNESGQTVGFLVSNNNPTLFETQPAIAANGALTFRPALQTRGSALVTVQAQDDGGTANGGVDSSAPKTFTINVVSAAGPTRVLSIAQSGEGSPGAGMAGGPPTGTVLSAFGPPAISDQQDLAARVTMRSGRIRLAGIYGEDSSGAKWLTAFQGGTVPGILTSGVTFSSFLDPVIAPGGAIAFAGKVKGGGVKANTDQGVWTNLFSGTLELALREGDAVPGLTNGEKLKAVTSLSIRDGELLARLTLAPAKGLVRAANDTALLRMTGPTTANVLLREGTDLGDEAGAQIKSFSVLSPAPGSNGHGRWHADGAVVAKVTLSNGDVRLVAIAPTGTVTTLLSIDDEPTSVDPDAFWKSFGLPAIDTGATHFAVAVALVPRTGDVTAANDAALLYRTTNSNWLAFARKGAAAPVTPAGPLYASFSDPVVNDNGDVAFLATLRGAGAKKGTTAALFAGPPASVEVKARLGDRVPDAAGTETAATWSKFLTYALPSGPGGGLVFLAETSGGDTTAKNKQALWGIDSTGQLRRLLRLKDALTVGGPEITKLTLLTAPTGVFGTTRSFNATGAIAVLATFSDKSQALLRIDIP